MKSDRLDFRIHGMDCADEVAILRRELEPLVGDPDRLAFDLLRGRMSVRGGHPAVKAATIVDAVVRSGMRAERWEDVPAGAHADVRRRWVRTGLTSASGALTVLGFLMHAARDGPVAAIGSEGTGLGRRHRRWWRLSIPRRSSAGAGSSCRGRGRRRGAFARTCTC